jgi:hypothetical protein
MRNTTTSPTDETNVNAFIFETVVKLYINSDATTFFQIME